MLVVPHDLKTFIHIFMSSETLFFPLQISECWLYHMTYIHVHLFICNETFFFLALFWKLVVPHDFNTFIHIFMSSETHFPLHISEYWLYHMTYRYFSFIYKQWNFFLAIFWMLVVPHDLQTCIHIFEQWNTYFLAIFWMLVVPHDLQTFIHIFMSSETLIYLQFSECWLFLFIYKQWNAIFFLASFWMLVIPHDFRTFFLYLWAMIHNFFPCMFWELVVPRDLQTFFHIYKQLNSFVTKYVENNRDKSLCFYALRMFYFFTGAFVFILLRG